MRRLQPFQSVELSTSTSFSAKVLAVHGRHAALHPDQAVDVIWLPEETQDVLLLFRHLGQRVILKGALHHRGNLDVLGFVVTDGVGSLAPATLVERCAPVGMTPVDATGRPQGDALWHQTAALSADALVLEPGCPLAPGTIAETELALPTEETHVALTGVVRRDEDGATELRFLEIEPHARARLRRYVAHEQLTDLRRRSAPQEVAYVW